MDYEIYHKAYREPMVFLMSSYALSFYITIRVSQFQEFSEANNIMREAFPTSSLPY